MEITVFAKNMKTKEGRSFRVYLSRLHNNRTGEEDSVRIQFREGLTLPTLFPVIIEVRKEDANLSTRTYTDDKGTQHVNKTLWVNEYRMSPREYVDHSLDDYE